ncbi:MAG: hypothetical protein JWO38_291, partial [Gemmataceae bacterium]|nr:hypothetical protein [Gemmataceae bacterium]
MPTDRQLAANRANAAHSTGPRTPDGKAAAKRNRLTHGIHSDAPVVPGECAADWDAHRAGVRASLAPVGTLEAELADRAATLLWRMRRVVRYET